MWEQKLVSALQKYKRKPNTEKVTLGLFFPAPPPPKLHTPPLTSHCISGMYRLTLFCNMVALQLGEKEGYFCKEFMVRDLHLSKFIL